MTGRRFSKGSRLFTVSPAAMISTSPGEVLIMAAGLTVKRREPLLNRLPVISHYRKSTGLQRGMLVAGLVLTGIFLLTAALAPVLSPYGFAERFGTQQPPSSAHWW